MSIVLLILGLFVGSFLNVVILRWDSDRSIVTGRSVCAHTGKKLPWYDLIPVFSFLMLRGKSRFSGKPISPQYPVVEIITGLLFAGTYWRYGYLFRLDPDSLLLFLAYLIIVCLLVVISF